MPEAGLTQPYVRFCPVGCGDTLKSTAMELPEGRLRRCDSCGQWVSACSEPRYWQSMREFDDTAGTLPKAGSKVRRFEQSRRRLNAIAAALAKSPAQIHLLDVGCSSGALLQAAVRLGFDAEGVEPAPEAARAAQSAGLRVRQGLLEEIGYDERSFDAVTLFEVIEHLPDPLRLLRECHRILRPGGLLMIGTGNRDSWTARSMGPHWEYLDISRHGGHISFFSPRSMRIAADRAGFIPLQMVTRNVRFVDKQADTGPRYFAGKLVGELLNFPARWLGKGHDMLAVLRRPR